MKHLTALLPVAWSCSTALGQAAPASPRQEDVFRGIRENVSQQINPVMLTMVFVLAIVLVLVLIALQHLRRRQGMPRVINSPLKLRREVAKVAGISRGDMQRLTELAARQQLSSPLLLLICPSLMEKAMKDSQSLPPGER